MFLCFGAGALTGWLLSTKGPPRPLTADASAGTAAAIPTIAPPATGVQSADVKTIKPVPTVIEDLWQRDLRTPIDGVDVASRKGDFEQRRAGEQAHEAVDLAAPRNTPVHAVDSGTIAKLFVSKAGGNTIYQFDQTGRLCYYYAHLERYEAGVREGGVVARADVLGYVGTSGNAPPNAPHLHFMIFELGPDRRWWHGTAIDPALVFHPHATAGALRTP